MARKEGFELEEAISCGGKCHRFRFFRSFCWYIIAFRAPLYIRLKGENKGENWAGYRLQPPVAAEIRCTPGGAAASWASWRPPSAASDGRGQTRARRHCCSLWAAWRPPSAARGDGSQTHARRCCRVLGVLKATFCARAAPRRREASGLSWTPASSGKAGTRCFSKGGRQVDTPTQLAAPRCRVVELCPNRTRSKPGQQKGTHDKNTRRYTLADCGHNSSHDSTSSASGSSRPCGFDILHVSLWPTSWQALPPCFSVSLSKVISYYK